MAATSAVFTQVGQTISLQASLEKPHPSALWFVCGGGFFGLVFVTSGNTAVHQALRIQTKTIKLLCYFSVVSHTNLLCHLPKYLISVHRQSAAFCSE